MLQQISECCYEDAVDLEHRVGAILPLPAKYQNYLGLWSTGPEDAKFRMTGKGNIYMRDDWKYGYNLARVVFAHECGHVLDRYEYRAFWDCCTRVPDKFFSEAFADSCLRRWGMTDLLKEVEKTHRREPRDERLEKIYQ